VADAASSEFDLGPLSWVKGEIGQALARTLDMLRAWKAAPSDHGSLMRARNHFHQAAGAIQMVGLDAVVVFTDEIERQLGRLEELPRAEIEAVCALIDRACRKLELFLDELVSGVAPVPLKLFPEYEAMQRARGVKASAATDLFFPDLSRAPNVKPPLSIPASRLPAHLIKQRREYETGLLAFLRGNPDAARRMRAAVAELERASTRQGATTFWWTVGAMFDAIIDRRLEASFGVKQLAGRLDLQMRRVVEGSAKVADRLRREVLYYVAVSPPTTASVREVQEAFALRDLVPSDAVLNADLVRLQPVLREMREGLALAKDLWHKVAAGRADSLPKLTQAIGTVHRDASQVGNPALSKLTAALVARLGAMPPPGNIPETLAMEYATGMLLADSAAENYGGLSAEFPKQVEAMLARLDAAQAGKPIPDSTAPILDHIFRRAQERALLTHVAREIQANLRHMEQVLDAFFRDHSKRADLATLSKDSVQIRGALRMLDENEAEQLLALCQEQIDSYALPDTAVGDVDLELLAESLSGLGFYVEAFEQQRPDRLRLIRPLLAKRLGEAPAVEVDRHAETVESAVEELRNALPMLVAEVHRAPADAAARALLKARLAELVDDAKLIDDDELVAQAQSALAELESGATRALEATVSAIAESSGVAAAPAISAETQRLLATDAKGLDAELLDIYLEEAAEVLDTIALNREDLERNPGDREALRTVRRQFHTLKGSGRMVGLMDLSEIAYDVEKIHNRLLEEEHPVTPAVLAMIGVGERDFRQWIATLKDTGDVAADPAGVHAAIAAVKAELPQEEEHQVEARPGAVLPEIMFPEVEVPSVEPEEVVAEAPEVEAVEEIEDVELFERIEPEPFPALGGDFAPIEVPGIDEIVAREVTAPSPAVEPPPKHDLVELPELGRESVEKAKDTVQWADADASEDGTVEEIEFLPAAAEAVGEEDEASAADEITIGDVTLSADLYQVLVDEAETHLATLATELSSLQFDPSAPPSAEMVRASHTLCGIHRTGGFPLIALTAKALEQSLIAMQQLTGSRPEIALPTLASAVQGLSEFVSRIRTKTGFTAYDEARAVEVRDELEALRQLALAEGAQEAPHPESELAHDYGTEGLGDFVARVRKQAGLVVAEAAKFAEDAKAGEAAATAELHAEREAPVIEPIGEPFSDVGEPVAHFAAAQEPIEPATPIADRSVADEAVARHVERTPAPVPAAGVAHVARVTEPFIAPMHAPRLAEPLPAEFTPDLLADIRDDVDEQVLPIFIEEATELYPQAGEQVRAWRRAPSDTTGARQLQRTLHTFKGSARMAGAMRLGELAHLMESRLVIDDVLVPGTHDLFEALDGDLDRIGFVLDALRTGRYNVALPSTAEPQEIRAEGGERGAAAPEGAAPGITAGAGERAVVVPLSQGAAAPAPGRAEAGDVEAGPRAMLRVRADVIDRLVNEAGEVAITRARIEGELRTLKTNLLELTNSVIRLRTQVREIEIQSESQIQSRLSQVGDGAEGFDPLEFDRYTRFQELARSIAEGVNDVSTVQQSLLKNLDDADAALLAQGRLSRDVQQQLFSIRTVPFGSLTERLYRILRGTAKELDKRANLEIRGGQTELDRSVLEKLVGPLEHLLRNSLDHGIEPRGVRAEAGKSETGEIALTVRQVGNEILIELSDDGAGLNIDRIREKAIAQGRFPPDTAPTDDQLIQCIFEPGFSTASKITKVSGRGIGMDVVRAEIAALGGRVEVATQPGNGTTFLLYLPLTLAVAQALLVRAGGRQWALPAPMVEQVQQVNAEALVNLYVHRRVLWHDVSYPFHYLPRLLGDTQQLPRPARHNSVLLLRSGQSVCAVHVDEMVGNQEVVVKNIGPQLARVSGIAGATVLGNGEIVLIINPVQLAQRADVPVFDPNAEQIAPEVPKLAAAQGHERPLVLIVDDSLTVRRITSRLLTREGFDVLTAKDGVNALDVLENETPDVILLDIEMPRMDGFEFMKTIKSQPKNARIPVVMITSRTAEKHRNRARELGVDLYLGKPFQEEELLKHLREMLELTA
jgi:chemosensory pili system protein ChpA (sensor histidine kinase/response regulator)